MRNKQYINDGFLYTNKTHNFSIFCDLIFFDNYVKGLELIYHYDSNGMIHNDNGPAIHDKLNSFNLYVKNGIIHKDDGPAFTYINKFNKNIYVYSYIINDKLHKMDGPAYIRNMDDDYLQYYIINGNIIYDENIILLIDN